MMPTYPAFSASTWISSRISAPPPSPGRPSGLPWEKGPVCPGGRARVRGNNNTHHHSLDRGDRQAEPGRRHRGHAGESNRFYAREDLRHYQQASATGPYPLCGAGRLWPAVIFSVCWAFRLHLPNQRSRFVPAPFAQLPQFIRSAFAQMVSVCPVHAVAAIGGHGRSGDIFVNGCCACRE